MDFKLESWEVPPGVDANNVTVPIEFGPVEWFGEQTIVSARWLELPSGEAAAFFRPHESGINFVATSKWDTKHRVSRKINSKTLGGIVREALATDGEWRKGRIFYCAGEGLMLFPGRAHWVNCNDFWQKESPIEIPFDTRSEASAQVFDWIQEQWDDTTSEIRASWEWNRKNERDREHWIGEIVPRWSELNRLMRVAAIFAELPLGAHWTLDHVDMHNHTPDLLARLQPWRELFEANFSFDPLPSFYPRFLRDYFGFASNHVQVVGQIASAHQQLEAKLYLRDWLQRNAPQHLDLIQ